MKGTDRFFVDGVECLVGGAVLPVANLSVGGFYVATDTPPAIGQVLQLTLRFGGKMRPVVGKVTWVNRGEHVGRVATPPGFGVQITRMELSDKIALIDLLRRTAVTPARH